MNVYYEILVQLSSKIKEANTANDSDRSIKISYLHLTCPKTEMWHVTSPYITQYNRSEKL